MKDLHKGIYKDTLENQPGPFLAIPISHSEANSNILFLINMDAMGTPRKGQMYLLHLQGSKNSFQKIIAFSMLFRPKF